MQLDGLPIRSSPLATRLKINFNIVKSAIRKRRKNYRVVRVETYEPCAYFVANFGWVMHPTLLQRLKGSTP